MTLEITLAPDEESRLRERAAATGKDVLAPVHESTRQSGLTVDEIDAMADRAREEYWADRAPSRNTRQP